MAWTAPALARNLDRDPIRELHQGQRPYAPHERTGHMTAPDRVAKTILKTPARGGRPHMIVQLPRAFRCGSGSTMQIGFLCESFGDATIDRGGNGPTQDRG